MKITKFFLENACYRRIGPEPFPIEETVFQVPQLLAYAIHHTVLELTNLSAFDRVEYPLKYELSEKTLILTGVSLPDPGHSRTAILTVFYAGLKSYPALFPQIDNEMLRERLGQFAGEAELAFDNQAWMSYVLMVGAVIEGMLFHQYGNKKFVELINLAAGEDILTTIEIDLLNEVRSVRNRIHASRYEEEFVGREIAMELSVTYERLLKRSWNLPSRLNTDA